MSRIDDIFADARAGGRTLVMPFLTGGFPTLEATEAAIPAVERSGATIVEIGFPFSDPIADGPTIAASMDAALAAGVTADAVLETIGRVRPATRMGLMAMVSVSIVDRLGIEAFVARAAGVGFDGLIVPDLDLDAAADVRSTADRHDLSLALLVAPTTTPARLERIAALSSGFVYLLARTGVTGEQAGPPAIERRVREVRAVTDLPVAVGFGISSPEHVAAVTQVADAAIVGSALVRRMGGSDDPAAAAAAFVAELARGLSSRSGSLPTPR